MTVSGPEPVAHGRRAGLRLVAVDPVLCVSDEPGKIQCFSLASLYGQALTRGTGGTIRTLRREKWPGSIVQVRLLRRIGGTGGNRRARDRNKDEPQW